MLFSDSYDRVYLVKIFKRYLFLIQAKLTMRLAIILSLLMVTAFLLLVE